MNRLIRFFDDIQTMLYWAIALFILWYYICDYTLESSIRCAVLFPGVITSGYSIVGLYWALKEARFQFRQIAKSEMLSYAINNNIVFWPLLYVIDDLYFRAALAGLTVTLVLLLILDLICSIFR